jgi:hypothetical protein
LLKTECAEDFEAIQGAVEEEIEPKGIMERMYVADICSIIWDILRLRRCKAVVINVAFREALEDLLTKLMRDPGRPEFPVRDRAEELAVQWFKDQKDDDVARVLSRFGLDESAIEAEAIRRSVAEIELIDRMLASLEARRSRALRYISEYRATLAVRLRENASRILEAKAIPRLEDGTGKIEPGTNARASAA